MKTHFRIPRFLVNFNPRKINHLKSDLLIIGTGIAGLSAAYHSILAKKNVIIVTKAGVNESNTFYAQGGIAAALNKSDSVSRHIQDTLKTGAGLCETKSVRDIITKGRESVKNLIDLRFPFDKVKGKIDFALEGGHSKARILHSHGDSTGRSLIEFFYDKIKHSKFVTILEHTFLIDIITDPARGGLCLGGLFFSHKKGLFIIFARRTILCTGGIGRIYRETTNPQTATGDGLSSALRAGGVLRDMEFVQFHPTTLYIAGATRALISETVRGEGAFIVDRFGRRFLFDYHPQGELAPRDAVSQAIVKHIKLINDTQVYLDLTHLDSEKIKHRFPTLTKTCEDFGIDISKDYIPIRPSAHYMIGGIKVRKLCLTNLKNLLACGECSSTGLHGANRLGSNSLLEGLVQGELAVKTPLSIDVEKSIQHFLRKSFSEKKKKISVDIRDLDNSLKSLMFRWVGVERNGELLSKAIEKIDLWSSYVLDAEFETPEGWELQNMLIASRLIATAALMRTESRGVHYRSDFPFEDNANWLKHIEFTRLNGMLNARTGQD